MTLAAARERSLPSPRKPSPLPPPRVRNSTGLTRKASNPAAVQERRLSSRALAVSATIGVGDRPQAASSRRKRRVASYPSSPGILRSIRMRSNGRDPRGVMGAARRTASSPSSARTTSKPNRHNAFCVMRALMSLSSATRARRAGADGGGRRGAGAWVRGKSDARRSNSERARTGFTSHPSKPFRAV